MPQSRLQYDLRSLLLLATAFTLLCAAVTILPQAINQLLVGAAWIAAIGWMATGVVFARGESQAFCLGVAVALSSLWTGVGGRFLEGAVQVVGWPVGGLRLGSGPLPWIELALTLAAGTANGRLCQRAYRYYAA